MTNFKKIYEWNEKKPNCFNFYEKKLLHEIRKINPKSILDIGSGNGYFCNQLNQYYKNIVGIEPSKDGFNISKKKFANIKFLNISCYDNPKKINQKFDLVISTEVIEHLYYPQKLLEFSRQCLNKNGYLIITTPYHGYLKNLLLSLFNHWDKHFTVDWDGGHIKFWSKKTLNKLIISNKFKVLKNKGVGRAPYIWKGFITIAKAI